MALLEKTALTIGIMPLLDSAPIVWAWHRGFFAKCGLNVELIREVSWASLRDRLAYDALDAAQCLAPMILAANLGADQVGVPFVSALTLSENWSAITLAKPLANQLGITTQMTPAESAQCVVDYLKSGQHLKLAHVFQFSMHNYLLHEWLSLAGLTQDIANLEFQTVTPARMLNRLQTQAIDGFCVGEPWNTVATSQGIGTVVTNAYALCPDGADKVVGVTKKWAQQYPHTHRAMITAIMQAQRELASANYYDELVKVMDELGILKLPESWLSAALEGASTGKPAPFLSGIQARPRANDYAWVALQMLRWGQWTQPIQMAELAAQNCDLACFDDVYKALNPQYDQLPPNPSLQPSYLDSRIACDYLIAKGLDTEQVKQLIQE